MNKTVIKNSIGIVIVVATDLFEVNSEAINCSMNL